MFVSHPSAPVEGYSSKAATHASESTRQSKRSSGSHPIPLPKKRRAAALKLSTRSRPMTGMLVNQPGWLKGEEGVLLLPPGL